MNAAIIVAAGRGIRMGGEVRKQYLPLAGQPILTRTLSAFAASGFFEEIILVVDASEIAYCRREVVEKWRAAPCCPSNCVTGIAMERAK